MDEKEIIIELLRVASEKEAMLEKLLQLTIAQKNLIQSEDIDKLNKAVEEKQQYIQKINNLDVSFISFYQKLKHKLNIYDLEEVDLKQYPSLKDLKFSVQSIISLLRKIDEIDKMNRKNLEADFEVLKGEMKKITLKKQSSKIVSSYKQKYVGAEGAFIDNKPKK